MSAVFGGRDVIDGDRDSRPVANLKQNVDSDSSGFCAFEAACRHNESYVKSCLKFFYVPMKYLKMRQVLQVRSVIFTSFSGLVLVLK